MTTPSFYEATGLSIHVFEPDVTAPYDPTDQLVTDQIGYWTSRYEHAIAALGGYESASITFNDRQVDIEDWIVGGVGRHIEVYNPALVKIWEGFVNSTSANVGPLSITRGPLTQIVNRCSTIYGSLDTAQNPPVQNRKLQTTTAQDTSSQGTYGIWEQVFSIGQTTLADAQYLRDTYLAEFAELETSQNLNLQGRGDVSVTLECRGYQDWLDAGIYNQTVNSGTIQMETKIADILDDGGADPNGLFASTNADIFASGILVPRYEDEDLKPRALISSMVALGDGTAADGRTIWGIYNDRRFIYEQVPTTTTYVQHLSDPAQRIRTIGGAAVQPWDVRAGEWVFFPDFLVGRTQPTALRDDPRYLFIENVRYTAPYGITLTGGKVSSLKQVLARSGLGSM